MLPGKSIRATYSIWVKCAVWSSVIIACLACSNAYAECKGVSDTRDVVGNPTIEYKLQPGDICHVKIRDQGHEFQAQSTKGHCGTYNFAPTIFAYQAGVKRSAGLPCTEHLVILTAPPNNEDKNLVRTYDITFTVQAPPPPPKPPRP